MKNKSWILGLGFILLYLVACSNNAKKVEINQTEKQEQHFLKYISKFKKIDLPFFFRGWTNSTLQERDLFELSKTSKDSIFYPDEPNIGFRLFAYGRIESNASFYSILYFLELDDLIPILVTYSTNGDIINSKSLIVNGCGSDCGLKYCCYTTTIDKDLNILLADTLLYNQKCFDEYITDSTLNYYHSKKGKISKDGKILF